MEVVLQDKLYRAERPCYPSQTPSRQGVETTVDRWLKYGVRSVICLIEGQQLDYYHDLEGGLLGYYKARGLTVTNIPVPDYKCPPLNNQEIEAVWQAYQQLPKPVLIHCSAGECRTGYAVDSLLTTLEESTDT